MIRTILIPDKQTVSINIPENYIGKQVEVLLYTTDELKEDKPANIKISQFRGRLNLTADQYKDFQQHVNSVRNEWEKDI